MQVHSALVLCTESLGVTHRPPNTSPAAPKIAAEITAIAAVLGDPKVSASFLHSFFLFLVFETDSNSLSQVVIRKQAVALLGSLWRSGDRSVREKVSHSLSVAVGSANTRMRLEAVEAVTTVVTDHAIAGYEEHLFSFFSPFILIDI